uniref:Sulfotransferase n=1 Tax=Malurus cyaneus samueli TaxID=2593467 RepID=A0A8C5T0Z3_9PASS
MALQRGRGTPGHWVTLGGVGNQETGGRVQGESGGTGGYGGGTGRESGTSWEYRGNIGVTPRAPWLEQIYCRGALRDSESRRLLTTHLPAPVLAPALQRSKAKVIYVARNPKDVAVSFYHFHRLAKAPITPQFSPVHYGSWFDHVKGWLGQRHLLDILYVTYEELTFLGCPLAPGTLEALEQHSRAVHARRGGSGLRGGGTAGAVEHPAPHASVTGVVGDWRGHFSPEQTPLHPYQGEWGHGAASHGMA